MRLFTLLTSTTPTMKPLYDIIATAINSSWLMLTSLRRTLTEQAITYSTSMTIALGSGAVAIITATNNTAFTINAPTGTPVAGEELTVVIRNTSGGALGAVTWDAVFKMSAWTQPATGFSRSISFRFDGTNWVQKNQTGVDVPN